MAHLIFEFQPPNFVKSHNFCRQITEKSLVIISESVSDLEKLSGSAPSIYIDVFDLPYISSLTNRGSSLILGSKGNPFDSAGNINSFATTWELLFWTATLLEKKSLLQCHYSS